MRREKHLRELMWELSSGEAEFLDENDPGFPVAPDGILADTAVYEYIKDVD